jgi:hypothetical protein
MHDILHPPVFPKEVSDHRVLLGPLGRSALSAAPLPAGIRYSLVHRQDQVYGFLHEPRIGVFRDTLFVNYSNAPLRESEPAQIMRGRRSADLGVTWSNVEVVAGGFEDGRRRHETAPLLALDGNLWAFIGRYDYGSKHSLGMEIYRLSDDGGSFEPASDGIVAPGFVPFVAPQRLPDGNWIIGGHIRHATQGAVAISHGDDMLRWDVVPIGYNMHPGIPETALLVTEKSVVALIRPNKGQPTAGVAVSYDGGRCFGPTEPSDLPAIDTKLFAGTLSTGHHYIIFNATDRHGLPAELPRHRLLVGIMPPGEIAPFERVLTLVEDAPAGLDLLAIGEPEPLNAWAYPEAIEHDGQLHIVFSMNKRHCWMASVPVSALLS